MKNTILDTITVYEEFVNSEKIDIQQIHTDSLIYDEELDIFQNQLDESKAIFEAIISDLTGDTLEAMYQFDMLFESLSALDQLVNGNDEFQTLEFNRILTAAIDYYKMSQLR